MATQDTSTTETKNEGAAAAPGALGEVAPGAPGSAAGNARDMLGEQSASATDVAHAASVSGKHAPTHASSRPAGRQQRIAIIGAGPAGITCGLELMRRCPDRFEVTILEETYAIGGISRTVCVEGNRMDIGGHRFFSKDPRVMAWWQSILPLQDARDCSARWRLRRQAHRRGVRARCRWQLGDGQGRRWGSLCDWCSHAYCAARRQVDAQGTVTPKEQGKRSAVRTAAGRCGRRAGVAGGRRGAFSALAGS